jgi:subtilase family serine protease
MKLWLVKARKFAVVLLGGSLVAASLVGATGKAVAAGGGDPQSASTIASLPFNGGSVDDPVPYQAGTGSANAKVASECNFGQPVYAPRWFAYTPTADRSVVASGSLTYEDGRWAEHASDGIALLSASLAVLDCNVRTPERPATVGPTKLAAGAKVYLVHFSRSSFCEPGLCIYDSPRRAVRVFDAPATYPAGDDWRTAVAITRVNTTYTTDRTLATAGADDQDCRFFYENRSEASTWWRFTPTQTGPLRLGAGASDLRLAELTASGPQWVPDPANPDWEGCEQSNGKTVQAGHTYLLYAPSSASASILGPTLGKPDLVVRSVSPVPAAPKVGDPGSFRVTITNQGPAPTAAGVIHGVSVQVDGVQQLWSDTFAGSLAPGASVTLLTNSGKAGVPTWPATAGSHVIKAVVDDINRVDETSEANNTMSVNLPVAAAVARPDLVVTSVTANPAIPASGVPVKFSATIKNQGSAATAANRTHSVTFSIDGVTKTWSRGFQKSIAAGASVTLTADGGPTGSPTWTGTSGPHTLSAAVDDQKLIAESDETNNQRQVQVNVGTIPTLPDLVLTSVSWTPTSPVSGAPVRFTASVKNVGKRTTRAGTVIGVSFRPNGSTTGATYSDTRTSPLLPGESALLVANGGGTSGQWTPPAAGSTTMVAVLDDTRRIAESNEFNNTLVSTVTIN